ncbi:Conserved_hypothetical protein [Hexamita inflata]|uniref:Uncharacterized protein n=1 Tax=Hexamita inflata TaxID=28002 RepID=A0AA86RC21_9EUKA|nr:Conserved hypothetical protein [Hexamita inflata]
MLNIVIVLNLFDCEAMLKTQVWAGLAHCEIQQDINFNLFKNVINVIDLHLVSNISRVCQYQLVSVPSGSLQNVIFAVNATINVDQCDQVYVSLFNSVNGKLTNVQITGQININSVNSPQLFLSKFVGFTLSGFESKTCSSSLKFIQNGEQILTEFLLTNFDDLALDIPEANVQLKQSAVWGFMKHNESFFTQTYLNQNQEATDLSLNAFPASIMYSNYYDTDRSHYIDLDANNKETFDEKQVFSRIYFQTGLVMVFFSSELDPIYCYDKSYDPIQKKCVNRCDNLNFNGICTDYCLQGFVQYINQCYEECPVFLNTILQDNICTVCPESTFATDFNTCVQYIPPGFLILGLGFVSVCPDGYTTLLDSCVQPTTCPENTYLLVNSTSTLCVASCPPNFALQGSSCVLTCENVKIYENCSISRPETSVQFQLSAKTACPPNFNNFSTVCTENCPELFGQNAKTRQCEQCAQFYTRKTKQCANKCEFYNNTICEEKCTYWSGKEDKKICADKCEIMWTPETGECSEKCPEGFAKDPANEKQCLSKCPAGSYNNGEACVSNCYPMRNDKKNGKCSNSCLYVEEEASGIRECIPFDKCSQEEVYKYQKADQCVSQCTPMFINNSICVDNCFYYQYDIYNIERTCMLGCTSHYIDEITHIQCIDKCPDNMVSKGTQCVIPDQKKNNNMTTIIIVCVSVGAAVIIAVIVGVVMCKRRSDLNKNIEITETEQLRNDIDNHIKEIEGSD